MYLTKNFKKCNSNLSTQFLTQHDWPRPLTGVSWLLSAHCSPLTGRELCIAICTVGTLYCYSVVVLLTWRLWKLYTLSSGTCRVSILRLKRPIWQTCLAKCLALREWEGRKLSEDPGKLDIKNYVFSLFFRPNVLKKPVNNWSNA